MKNFLFSLIIFCTATIFFNVKVVQCKQLAFPHNGITKLIINSSINELTVKGMPSTNSIDGTITNPINISNVDLKLTKDKDIAYLSIHPKPEKKDLINMLITLPQNLNVEIIDEKSNLKLYNLHGKVDVTDNENNILIENTENLYIKDKSGDIIVNNKNTLNSKPSTQGLIIEDGSGDINLNNINGIVRLIDSSGNINVNQVNGNVDMKNGSGNIDVKNVTRKVFIDDGSGDINIENVGELILKEAGSGQVFYDKNKIPSLSTNTKNKLPQGIYMQKNGGAKTLLDTSSPIDIEPNSNVIISIADYNNLTFNKSHLKSELQCLIPNLIRNVGEGSSVTINIDNSANVEVTDSLIIGEKNYDINNNIIEQVSSYEPALINSLIVGKVGAKSTIKININNSANVTLANNNSALHIGGGSLIESPIDISSHLNTETTAAKEISVNIKNSSNVRNKTGNPLGKLTIYRGQLINEIVDANSIINSKINVHIDNSCKVSTGSLEIVDAELIDEIIDCEDINSADIAVNFTESANVNTLSQVKITDGELIDEIVDMETATNSKLNVNFFMSSNVNSKLLSIYEGELIDETLDGEGYNNSNIDIEFNNSSNFYGDQLIIDNGELIDEVIDSETFNRCQVKIAFKNTSNINCDSLKIFAGELIDETVDIEDGFDNTTMNITLTSTAKITGNSLEITSGELIDEIIDSANGVGSSLNVFLKDTANFYKKGTSQNHVSITEGELMDEILDLSESLSMIGGNLTIDSSANIISDTITLENSQLIDEIVDGTYVNGTILNVTVSNSVNAKTPNLNLIGDSTLLTLFSIDSQNKSNINYNIMNSGKKL